MHRSPPGSVRAFRPVEIPGFNIQSTASPFQLAAWIAALALIACGGEPAPTSRAPLYTTRDSAGITILEYRMPDTTDLERWEISEATLAIGREDDPDYALTRPGDVMRMDDGRIIVGLPDEDQLRVFDSTGHFVRRIGRRGQGPGEFSDLRQIGRIRSDTIVAYNRYPERIVVFSPEGDFIRASRLVKPGAGDDAGAEFPAYSFQGFLGDGSVLVARHPGERPIPPGGVKVDSIRPLRLDARGTVLADYGKRWDSDIVRVQGTRGARFGPSISRRSAHWGLSGSQLYYSARDRFEIELWSPDGRLTRIVRLATLPIVKTTADSFIIRGGGERFDATTSLPDTLPPIGAISGDRDGNLWITMHPRAFPTPVLQIVFDSTGILQAHVRMRPDTAAPVRALRHFVNGREISRNHIVSVAFDSLDVPFVVVRRILRQSSDSTRR